MVKCLGICFSLCCALCSPPQRTHGGSNTAVTTKRESNSHVKKKEIKPQVQSLLTKHFIAFCFPELVVSLPDKHLHPHQLYSCCAYIELLSEKLAVVSGANPVLLLQRVQRDREVPLRGRGRSREEDHCLLSCV